MSNIGTQLFDNKDIRLGPIDHDKDPEIESRWTHDAGFMRLYDIAPSRPMSPAIIRKRYEKLEKQMDEDKDLYYFAIRAKQDDRLIGKALIEGIEWTNGNGLVQLGIGSAEDRRKGYGSQALSMLIRFAFAELNLFRVSAQVPEYNKAALSLFEKFGFVEEVRRRQALDRDGRRWNLMIFGLLSSEWPDHARV